MKLKNYFFVLSIAAILFAFQSFKNLESSSGYHDIKPLNSGGPAASGNGGRTGAPGEGTCANCHGGGSFSPSITLVVRNSANAIVTSYNAGEVYNLTFTVSASSSRFGMQATSLNAANAARGTFSSPSANAQISSSGGRTYLEHDAAGTSGVFTSQWTAPVAGTGTVTFYFAGLAANGTGGTNGDSVVARSLQLTDASLSLNDFEFSKAIKIEQSPVKDVLSISINESYEKLKLEIVDITGKKVYENEYSKTNAISVNLNSEAGVYFLKVTNENNASTKIKFIKE